MTHINTSSYISGTGTTITLPFSLWLNIHYSGIVCGEKWHEKTVPGKKCLDEIQKRKRNFMNIIPSTCFKYFFYCCFLLTVKPKQSQSVYPFPRNSIVPSSKQWRETIVFWNVSRAVECRPVLVLWLLFGEPLGVYQRQLRSAQSNQSCFLAVVAFLFLKLNLCRAPG